MSLLKSKFLIGTLIALIFTTHSFGQSETDSSYLFVGLDIGKTLFANFKPSANSGLTAEVLARTGKKQESKVSNGFFFSAGYSWLKRDTIYPNVDFQCQGFFLRAGIELFHPLSQPNNRPVFITYGLNLVASQFKNTGVYKIPGDYFPDYRQTNSIHISSFGLQLATQLSVPFGKSWLISTGINGGYLLNPLSKNNTKTGLTYYHPGIGFTQDRRWALGLSLQIFYQLK